MFEATARLKIRDGQLEGFKHQVTEIVRLTRASDLKPLRYDWFLSADGTECEVREAYENGDDLLAQQKRIGDAKRKLFRDHVAGHEMEFFGELSPALAGALEAMGTTFNHYSFFQGLEAEIGVPA